MLRSLVKGEEGQGLVEYGLILFLISVTVLTLLTLMGNQISSVFNSIVTTL